MSVERNNLEVRNIIRSDITVNIYLISNIGRGAETLVLYI